MLNVVFDTHGIADDEIPIRPEPDLIAVATRLEPPVGSAVPAELSGGHDPIAVAVAFMAAQDGGPERVLRTHAPNHVGDCERCRAHLRAVRWPCTPAAIALAARDVQNSARPAADPDPGVEPS